jgi:hypothetical protein
MLPRAAEGTLPPAILARVEPNWTGSFSAAKGFQCAVLFQLRRSCGFPVVLSRQNGESIISSSLGHNFLLSALFSNTLNMYHF